MSKTDSRIRAEKYFAAHGINPNIEGEMKNPKLDVTPTPAFKAGDEGVTTVPCEITVEAFLFYMYCEVTFVDPAGKSHKFCGNSGGIGVGDLETAGVIYYADLETLITTAAFGVAFIAEEGGVVQVTWGTHGNASAAGVGEGGGAFGGSGSWS